MIFSLKNLNKETKQIFFVLTAVGLILAVILIQEVYADIGTIDPNGDGTQSRASRVSCAGADFFECIDDGIRQPNTPDVSDFITFGTGDFGFYQMNSISGINQATQVDVWVFHVESKINTFMDIELWDSTETVQYGSTATLANAASQQWDSTSFSGLSLSQSELDGLRVRLSCRKQGRGSPGECSAYAMYADVNYTTGVGGFSLEQVSFRWRNDDGGESGGGLQSAGFINPDSDFLVGWDVVSPGPDHFAAIDEGATPDTLDYTEATNRGGDEFDMTTISGSGNYGQVDVFVHVLTANNDRLGVNLVINGVEQTEQIIVPSTGFSWHSVSFSGLSMNQSDLDSLRIKLNHVKRAGRDSVRVATLRAQIFEQASGATFKATENTPVGDQAKNENVRVRFLVKNNDPDPTGAINYRLQFSPMVGADCSGGDETFIDVPDQASCSASAACLTISANFNDQDATSNISPGISDPSGTFVAGKLVEDPSNEASSISLTNNQFTELEYNFQFTDNALDAQDYCFRAANGATSLDTYTQIAKITVSGAPPGYAVFGTYISSDYNALSPSIFNIIEWDWSKTNPTCSTCNIRLQIQTAPDVGGTPGAWSSTWSGPEGEDGDETDYFTVSSGELIHVDHNGDQWIRYRATFDGDGTDTPILEEIRINYQ